MKVEIKHSNFKPQNIESLFNFFNGLNEIPKWEYMGLIVELDPTIDFKGNDALIRWTDINEGFNDKLIINSLSEFKANFNLVNA